MRDPQSGEDATGLAGRRRWRPAADRADEDGDDERPEVDLLATAERMSVIRHLSACLMPCRSSNPLPVSTRECTPSESIAELPVTAAAANFVAAMHRLPAIAAYTTAVELRVAIEADRD